MNLVILIIGAVCPLYLASQVIRWRKQAWKAQATITYLESLIKSATLVAAMLRGQKPVVTVAPPGLTIEEGQMIIDNIYKSVHGERSN